jgi:hypothetical protein
MGRVHLSKMLTAAALVVWYRRCDY